MKLKKLEVYLFNLLTFDKFLNPEKIDPYMTNGLMVRGSEEISRIGFGVSASLALFENAAAEKCDTVIVHHSFNLPPYNRFDKIFQDRLAYLISHRFSLFGYHFLLDAHPQIGNNVEILKAAGAKAETPYLFQGSPWGYSASFSKEEPLEKIINKLKPFLSPRTVLYDFGPKMIKKAVAVSGKGAPRASEMQNLTEENIDLYITGEVHEWNRELFREAGINLIAGGHYHTEMFGIKALMQKVQQDLPELSAVFLDLENEV
ncbi:Nif3-like dinuclear metal center hexameric protein [Candidatus Gottesmanbacteria bacterium RIFCSPLOWO2_02_FULL_42_29]|uniref:Nif3-like dinuclear metal center hexameric protein n=2 Tax=Candidatus Gottesmaniibacteriota TaxID=1752720 RepID=A0A1F6BEZ3_9BACT|nr:MAG: hypothetical protein UV09_C0023G0029 [Candidatus Gottesmanbacteria bacterium GW2011_GWA2_42_18]OGG12263.1 MAG: Nif3-like dinuclear metal center hexameric protein [Candidatus Gottesmanbacteria bacterium RIFCSPHIGHO2_01_FULL_42_27]OGG35383.1 MAG: Nif3-like dinuclear metal center hexameric protein [Candidatus Gottesmanbacteria bacterium RIFCSPLOWO2_01_FULL_42_22]OGG35399.1 MAG: Nif3-like dinuclear metal center hexameric protein [Candidatus Gottesmanbacteria bacterium RIFCSPLOWO2_12_FULL_42_